MDSKDKVCEEDMDSLSSGVAQIGLNVMAPAFVPSFLVTPNTTNNINNCLDTTPTEDTIKAINSDNKQTNNEQVVDDWEANADEDDDEDEDGDGDGDDGIHHIILT